MALYDRYSVQLLAALSHGQHHCNNRWFLNLPLSQCSVLGKLKPRALAALCHGQQHRNCWLLNLRPSQDPVLDALKQRPWPLCLRQQHCYRWLLNLRPSQRSVLDAVKPRPLAVLSHRQQHCSRWLLRPSQRSVLDAMKPRPLAALSHRQQHCSRWLDAVKPRPWPPCPTDSSAVCNCWPIDPQSLLPEGLQVARSLQVLQTRAGGRVVKGDGGGLEAFSLD